MRMRAAAAKRRRARTRTQSIGEHAPLPAHSRTPPIHCRRGIRQPVPAVIRDALASPARSRIPRHPTAASRPSRLRASPGRPRPASRPRPLDSQRPEEASATPGPHPPQAGEGPAEDRSASARIAGPRVEGPCGHTEATPSAPTQCGCGPCAPKDKRGRLRRNRRLLVANQGSAGV
jgi:hypothetical protein